MKYSKLKDLLMPFVLKIRLIRFRTNWVKKNKHNHTLPNSVFPIEKVRVGKETYGELNIKTYGNNESLLIIGDYCSIAENVYFIIDGEHNYKRFTSYPFPSKLRIINDSGSKGPIIVEDDVWIGFGSIILSGVTIGKGSIIGAGSVVSRDIPPYSIFANGRIIKERFSDQIIQKLNKLCFRDITLEFIKNNYKYLIDNISDENIDEIVEIINKCSKR